MKKIISIFISLTIATTVWAVGYQQSVGLMVGNFTGFSYKLFLTDKVALQSDLGVGIQGTAGGIGGTVFKDGVPLALYKYETLKGITISIYDFVINENVLYQVPIKKTNISYILGAGMSLGFGSPYKMTSNGLSNWQTEEDGTNSGNPEICFKYGMNVYIGAEYKVPDAPITFGADFRPGYGLLATHHDLGGDMSESIQYHFFDWRLTVSMRYCF